MHGLKGQGFSRVENASKMSAAFASEDIVLTANSFFPQPVQPEHYIRD